MSSIVATRDWTGSALPLPSTTAKAGALAMARDLAVDGEGKGVRLNAIAPGTFATLGAWEMPMPPPGLAPAFETKNPLKRLGKHAGRADLAANLPSDFAGKTNGEAVSIDGGDWLQGAGEFSFPARSTDQDWAAHKPGTK